MIHVEHFGLRFSYLFWLRHLIDGVPPTFAEVGRAVHRTGPAVGAWVRLEKPPKDYELHQPLIEFFHLESQDWLIHGRGDAPRPDLWKEWVRYRRTDLKAVPRGSAKQITRADVEAAKRAAKKRNA